MKRIIYLLTALCLVLGLTACGEAPVSQDDTSDNTSSSKAENESSTTVEPETSTEPAKIYDVYVNGVGYDIGTTLEFKVTLKADDKEFTSCCPSFNIFLEGVTDPDVIENSVDMDLETYINPLLICNSASPDYDNEYYSYWGYYDLLALWESPDAEPLDITDGIHVYSSKLTFKEAGKYTVNVTSGNGAEDMTEWFAKYDNCFSVEVIEAK